MGDEVRVKADTPQEFVENARKILGKNRLGVTSYKRGKPQYVLDPKTKTIKSAKLSFIVTMKRAAYAGFIKKKPEGKKLAAINKVESLIKAHEEAHKDSMDKVFKAADLKKQLVGKTLEEAQTLWDKLDADLLEACETLHKTGGKVTVDEDDEVTESAEGDGGCK